MEKFQAKYIEDTSELLTELEKNLLELEKNPNNSELIESVFRAMHTLKGASSMFGFAIIGKLTHLLETVYDFIREGKLKVDNSILNLTLTSVDHIRSLLNDPELENEENQKNQEVLSRKITELVEKTAENAEIDEELNPDDEDEQEDTGNGESATYYILFHPEENVNDRGINLSAIFEELEEYGECKTITHSYQPAEDEEIPKFYLFWEIFITTSTSPSDLKDIFIFVEDECEIHQLSDRNLLIRNEFIEKIDELTQENQKIDIATLKNFSTQLFESRDEEKDEKHSKPSFTIKEHKTSNIKVSSEKLDELVNLVSELVTKQAELTLLSESHPEIIPLAGLAENIQKLTRRLRDNALDIRLIPISEIIFRFRRMVRDISKELGKEVEFVTEGIDTELDKTVIDGLSSPLMHILRNSIDHGIELPAVRKNKGKPARGRIFLKAFYSGSNVHISVADDGSGINLEKVKEKAISKGLISPEQQIEKEELLQLVFTPGFSTAEGISEVSGRGVGMDVVKQKISEIRGEVEVTTDKDQGTTTTIILPQTLSIVDALLVKVENTHFFIPLSVVDVCTEEKHKELFKSQNQRFKFDDNLIPFISLRRRFDIEGTAPEKERIVIVKNERERIGVVVDSIVGEHQAVLKPLGEVFKKQEVVSGASILGDGSVALVLDTEKIIKQMQNKL